MKSGVSPQKLRAVNTNLGVFGLDLHSKSPEPVNFFGAQSSLGGDTIFVWGDTSTHLGGHGPGMPPRGAEPTTTQCKAKSMNIKPDSSMTFCQFDPKPYPAKPGPTLNHLFSRPAFLNLGVAIP